MDERIKALETTVRNLSYLAKVQARTIASQEKSLQAHRAALTILEARMNGRVINQN